MYWILCTLGLLFFSIIESRVEVRFKKFIFVMALVLLFIGCSGNYYNGVDWIHYKEIYDDIYTNDYDFMGLGYEPGYILLNVFFAKTLGIANYHYLVVFISFFASLSFYLSLRNKYLINRSFYCTLLFMALVALFSDLNRQCLAFFILLPAIIKIDKISRMNWFIFCVFAAMFHSSAIILYPIKGFLNRTLNKWHLTLWFGMCFCFVLFLFFVYENSSSLSGFIPEFIFIKLSIYLESFSGQTQFGLFAIVDILCIYFYCRFSNKNSATSNAVLLYFSLHLVFYVAPFLQRVTFYILPLVVLYFFELYRTLVPNGVMLFFVDKRYLFYMLFICLVTAGFIKQISNQFYWYDFWSPKFFYFELIGIQSINPDVIRFEKCIEIDQIDTQFCHN